MSNLRRLWNRGSRRSGRRCSVSTASGVHDNFFELGGDSILSIQVVARARQAGFDLTPKQFFQHQTIAELAAVVPPLLPHVPTRGQSPGMPR